jgi:excisionase family DNA binding protein
MTKHKGTAVRAVLTVKEAADTLGIGINQAYDAIKSGQIPSLKIGKRIIIPRVALERKLESAT